MTAPQENAIGIEIFYTVLDATGVAKDISLATVKTLVFRKPDRTIMEKAAIFATDGADGVLKYVSVDGDLVPYGTFQVQAKITMPNFNGKTEVKLFDVQQNLS